MPLIITSITIPVCAESTAWEHRKTESGEKGSAVQRAFGLGHCVLARTAGWTLPSP